MSKKRPSDLEVLQQGPQPLPPAAAAIAAETAVLEKAAQQAIDNVTAAPAIAVASITVPLAEPLASDRGLHVDAQLWEAPQRLALRKLRSGLRASGARLGSGQAVKTAADAVRWLLEQIAAHPAPAA